MLLHRSPNAALRPYVERLWVFRDDARRDATNRHWLLPNGGMQLVFRFSPPLRVLLDESDTVGRTFGSSLVGGIRTQAYLREVAQPEYAVGARLRAGAGALLLGVPADALAFHHTSLDDLWGIEAELARERLAEASTPEQQLDVLEGILLRRVARAGAPSPLIHAALAQIARGATIARLVDVSGVSHRHFVAQFTQAVGLTPKLYARVLRFARSLELIHRARPPSWAALALTGGYSDQAHFVREFRAFSGLTPSEYGRQRLEYANHVPVPLEVNSLQDHRRARAS
jgi:AraC-like DNA-binding protein